MQITTRAKSQDLKSTSNAADRSIRPTQPTQHAILLDWWCLPASTLIFQSRRYRKHNLLFPRTRHDLHSDRQTFRRLPHWNYRSRSAQQIEPLAIAPRVKILHGLSLHLPTALTVAKRGNGGHRTNEDRILLHLAK